MCSININTATYEEQTTLISTVSGYSTPSLLARAINAARGHATKVLTLAAIVLSNMLKRNAAALVAAAMAEDKSTAKTTGDSKPAPCATESQMST